VSARAGIAVRRSSLSKADVVDYRFPATAGVRGRQGYRPRSRVAPATLDTACT